VRPSEEPRGRDSRIRVSVVARDPLSRAGLIALLSGLDGIEVTSVDFDPRLGASGAELVVADLRWEVSPEASQSLRDLPFVALVEGEAEANAARRAGALGILSREVETEELEAAIRAVRAGLMVVSPTLRIGWNTPGGAAGTGPAEPLTPREAEILEALSSGASNRAIAHRLGIRESTVKFHVNSILAKLGAQSRTEAVALALRSGLLRV
jgi:two-component system nitrate/nitrite response regulator NarL